MQFTDRLRGFTLLEILVTLTLLSIGFLGLANLQLTAIKHNLDVAGYAQASLIVAAMAERIRANPAAAPLYTISLTANDCGTAVTHCADSVQGEGATCSASAIASFDIHELVCGDSQVNSANASQFVEFQQLDIQCSPQPCTPSSFYAIDLQWRSGVIAGDQSVAATGNTGDRSLHLTVKPQ